MIMTEYNRILKEVIALPTSLQVGISWMRKQQA